MSNAVLNTLILSVLLAAAAGGGYYVTRTQQPARLAEVEGQIEAIENRSAQVQDLMAQQAAASTEAATALDRWNSRYKILPTALSSAEVVAYLNALSSRGFHRFDLSLSGLTPGTDASYYTYQVTGEAYFESLFSFIWHLENGRGLYRVRDLALTKTVVNIPNPATGVDRQVVLAQFAMAVDAYYGGSPDLTAPDSAVTPPREAFPARRVAVNPFFPFVLETVPGNTDDLVDVETDVLLAVTGGTAVFQRNGETRMLTSGSRVYLGRISRVDPTTGRVVADLNKGGIGERIEISLETGERYRQALGRSTLVPTTRARVPAGPSLDRAPAAPGTPGAAPPPESGDGAGARTSPSRSSARGYTPAPIGR